MDNLTHTAIGLFLSRAGLGSWSARATPIVVLAANAPDIDVLSAVAGPLNYLHYHRHLTHSLAAMPVVALAVVAAVRLAGRKPLQWRGAFFAALIGVASHLLLDWTNVYGVRLLLPFSGDWLRLDWTFVGDLWIWGVSLICILGPFLARLVGSEISSGTARVRHHGRGFAWFALLFVLLYNCGRGVLHDRAAAALGSRMYQEAAPLQVAAMPDPVSPLRWRGIVETSDGFVVEDLNLAGDVSAAHSMFFHRPEADPALDAARRTTTFQEFLRFSQIPLWKVTPLSAPEGSKAVEIFDLRFGSPLAPGFMVRAVVNSRLEAVESSFGFGGLRPK